MRLLSCPPRPADNGHMTRTATKSRPFPPQARPDGNDLRPAYPARRWRRPHLPFRPIVAGFALAGAVVTTLLAWLLTSRLNLGALVAYVAAVNCATLLAYLYDKSVAGGTTAMWRVPEPALHLFALAGGTPAAFVAQQVLRHKTRKAGFRTWFWLIVIFQIAAVGAWFYLRSH